jgi:putative membrane protein
MEGLEILNLVMFSLFGAVFGAVLALIPALHLYAIAALFWIAPADGATATLELHAFFLLGALAGWVIWQTPASVLIFAPDDTALITVLPATKLLLRGRADIALRLLAAGMLAGLIGLLVLAPLLDTLMRPLRSILQPHMGWIVVAIIVFMVLGEWPRADDMNPSRWRRLGSAWVYLGAGLATFLLSGALGLILMVRSPLAIESGFQSMLPVFSGLFTLPGMIQIALQGRAAPAQTPGPLEFGANELLRGGLIGLAGGLFASFLPVVSGGVGAMLAGHAAAQREDRIFLIAQGANRAAYLLGSALLLFVPGLTLTRGGFAALLSLHYVPAGWRSYWLAVGVLALSGALALAALWQLAPRLARLAPHLPLRAIVIVNAFVCLALVFGFTGLPGLGVCAVATLIGLIPVAFGGRRLNCLGVLLIPVSLNMTGYAVHVAEWFGLYG